MLRLARLRGTTAAAASAAAAGVSSTTITTTSTVFFAPGAASSAAVSASPASSSSMSMSRPPPTTAGGNTGTTVALAPPHYSHSNRWRRHRQPQHRHRPRLTDRGTTLAATMTRVAAAAGGSTTMGWTLATPTSSSGVFGGVGGGGNYYHHRGGGGWSVRSFSDNLLGYSPMANAPPSSSSSKKVKETPTPQPYNPGASGPSFGVDHNTAGGGVWNNTSYKREKLTELKAELAGDMHAASASLDDAATPGQRLDLHLAEGIGLIARSADEGWPLLSRSEASWVEFRSWLDGSVSPVGVVEVGGEAAGSVDGGRRGNDGVFLDRDAFESHLMGVAQRVAPLAIPASEGGGEDAPAATAASSPSPLAFVREFVESPSQPSPDDGASTTEEEVPRRVAAYADEARGGPGGPDVDADVADAEAEAAQEAFDECASMYRATLVSAAADHLRESWDALTSVTDSDVDRAAVDGVEAPPATTVSASALNDVVRAYAFGTAEERLRAMWALVDRDGDGLIDQEEMDRVVSLTMTPVENAMRTFFDAVIQSGPVRDVATDAVVGGTTREKEFGWRQRRLERKTKKRLRKMFDKTIKRHFDVEVETPHRLRCVYAWADKSHQDGKVESVLVDSGTDAASAIMGKKRYVELHPKIAHDEFVTVQREQFPHLDRVGQEIATSFKEDLLVDQGRGRQNRELRREVMGFLVVVGLLDYIILSL